MADKKKESGKGKDKDTKKGKTLGDPAFEEG